jgi:TRAP-type C4-dicarboxylate transport system permease small subunit
VNETKELAPDTGITSTGSGLNKAINILDKVGIFSRWTNFIGIAALGVMILVTFINVFLRYVFNRPIAGVEAVTEVAMICAVFFAVAHTHNTKSHISVDLIPSKLSTKPRLALEFIVTLLSVGLFGLVSWRMAVYTMLLFSDQRVHDKFIGIPSGPFGIVIIIGCVSLFLLLFRDLLSQINDSLKLRLSWRYWLAMVGIPVGFVVLA